MNIFLLSSSGSDSDLIDQAPRTRGSGATSRQVTLTTAMALFWLLPGEAYVKVDPPPLDEEDDANEDEDCESDGPCWPVTLGKEVVLIGGRLVVLSGVAVDVLDPMSPPG